MRFILPLSLAGGLALAVLAAHVAAGSPFLASPSPVKPAEPASVLGRFELTGILAVGSEVQVCLVDTPTQKTTWLTVGHPSESLQAEAFDASRESVLLRSGNETRWVGLRRARVADLPVARLADGAVDWFHMKLPDAEKAREADLLMWDILEVGRQASLRRAQTNSGAVPK